MWFDYGMQKINTAGPGEVGHQSCIKPWPMVEQAKKFFLASSHTTSTSQSPEQPSRHTKNNAQLLQYLQTKERSMLQASHCRYW